MHLVGFQEGVHARHVGARFSNEKTLGCQWSRLWLELGIVGDVTTAD